MMTLAGAVPVTVNNLTPTFWSVIGLCVIAVGALIKVWPMLDKQKRAGDASLREDLMGLLATRDKRITELESDIINERRRCDEEMSKLRAQVDALQRMIVQLQISTGNALHFSSSTPSADASIERVAKIRGMEE